jgi:hypothetical protein
LTELGDLTLLTDEQSWEDGAKEDADSQRQQDFSDEYPLPYVPLHESLFFRLKITKYEN